MKKIIISCMIFGILFLLYAICLAASVSGTHKVDGSNPAADRFKVVAFGYGTTRDINQVQNRFGTASVAGNGTWSISGFNAGEDVIICIYDFATNGTIKKGLVYEDTAE